MASQLSLSFHKLFLAADMASGLAQALPPKQEDTADFEALFTAAAAKGTDENHQAVIRYQLPQLDIEQNRVMTKKIAVYPEDENVVLGVYAPDLIKSYSQPAQAEDVVLELDWSDEVNRTMQERGEAVERKARFLPEYDSDEQPKSPRSMRSKQDPTDGKGVKKTPFRRMRRLQGNLAPYHVYDPDLLDLRAMADPLDVFIPNEEYDDDEDGLDEHMLPSKPSGTASTQSSVPTQASSRTSAAPSIKATIFDRHARNQREPLPDVMSKLEDDSMVSKFQRDKQRKLEKAQRIQQVSALFDTTSSLIKSAKRSRDNKSHQTALLNHHNLAVNHKNSKPDLLEMELKYFHRPRMSHQRPWTIQVPAVQKKAPPGAELTRILHNEADKQNLSLASDHTFMLVEYVEEFPPIMLNYGMASTVLNYYRSPEMDEDEGGPSKVAKGEGPASNRELVKISQTLNQHHYHLPRHVMMLLSLRNHRPYEYDASSIPRCKLGTTKVLAVHDDSPFLGNIAVGEIQSALINNLFRTPLFPHYPPVTDFLLVRLKVSANEQSYFLREIPHFFLAGQCEPLRAVPKPSNRMNAVQEKFYMLSIVRYLQSHSQGTEYADIFHSLCKYISKEAHAPHKGAWRSKFKDLLRAVAEEERDEMGTVRWYPKDLDKDKEHDLSVPVLTKAFTPEDVCLQEACNAAEYRMFQQHITDMELSKLQAYLHHMHKVKAFRAKRLEVLSHLPNRELWEILKKDYDRLEKRLSIARFIFDRLVVAPWNTTDAFLSSDKMMLQGIGDPSGRGEGFAYVKQVKTETKKVGIRLVGTDKDLRKLTKIDAIRLLMALGVKRVEAEALKRWDRIHMIREMVNKMDKLGVIPKDLEKYVRDPNNNNSAAAPVRDNTDEQYAVIAQDIWNRQKVALSAAGVAASAAVTTDEDDEEEMDLDLEGALSKFSKPSQAAAEQEDVRELGALSSLLDGTDSMEVAEAPPAPSIDYPQKVVRRLTRTVKADGSEVITVQFIFSEDVRKVETNALKAAKDRALKRISLTAFTDSSLRRTVEDDLPSSMTLKVGKMRTMAGSGLVLKKGRKMEDDGVDGEGIVTKTKRSGGGTVHLQTRLPRVCFAGRLEKELMTLWKMPSAGYFWYPVDVTLYPNYYSLISNPICLKDMRTKIASYDYSTAAQMEEDMRLLVANAEKFNGPDNAIAAAARKMLDVLVTNLSHERKHFGAEKDTIGLLEGAIQRKQTMLSAQQQRVV